MYQSPETYVRQFLEQVFGDAYVYREVRTPYLKLVADYATENVVIETEPPAGEIEGENNYSVISKSINTTSEFLLISLSRDTTASIQTPV